MRAPWRGVFRQLVAAGCLDVDTEGYGGLRLADASRAVLRGGQAVLLRKELPRKRERGERDRGRTTASRWQPADEPLFESLAQPAHATRARTERAAPTSSSTTAPCATSPRCRPATLDDLAQVGGIGGTKLERYGEQVLTAIRASAPAE